MKVESYLEGKWVSGTGDGKPLFNAINGDIVGLQLLHDLRYLR